MILIPSLVFAKMHEFETAHLKSMGGTGVAGMFMEESAFLNPAGLAFYTMSDIYLQRDMMQIKNDRGDVIQKPKSTAVVIADGNANLSGSVSYLTQEEGQFKRTRWGATTSTPVGVGSAFGLSIRKTEDKNTSSGQSVDYYQTVMGITHTLNAQTSFGVVAYDVFNSKGDETKALIGFQHILADAATFAFDFGGDYNSDEISKTLLYRGGVQLKVLNDFFLRLGAFKDKTRQEKGNGYGVAWVQPKLAFEFSLKNTKQVANLSINRTESKIREASFGISFRF